MAQYNTKQAQGQRFYTQVGTLEDLMVAGEDEFGEYSHPVSVGGGGKASSGHHDDDEDYEEENYDDEDFAEEGRSQGGVRGLVGRVFSPSPGSANAGGRQVRRSKPVRRPARNRSGFSFKSEIGQKIAAFVGLVAGVAMWWVGGLCFSYTCSALFGDVTKLASPLNFYPWLVYFLISYAEIEYLPTSIEEIDVTPKFILVGVGIILFFDLGGAMNGALKFWSNKSWAFGNWTMRLSPNDWPTILLGLGSGIVLAIFAEPTVRYFWHELFD